MDEIGLAGACNQRVLAAVERRGVKHQQVWNGRVAGAVSGIASLV